MIRWLSLISPDTHTHWFACHRFWYHSRSGRSLNTIDGCCRGMSTGIISTDAIQDALQRAKELAASSHSNPQKRPNSDDSSNRTYQDVPFLIGVIRVYTVFHSQFMDFLK
uniref:Uncharacterized protein n=2 Tax=Onchocercidae TaxID=6296 RepID=A0A8R1XTY3_ONCVO